jgi:hypothetical protein
MVGLRRYQIHVTPSSSIVKTAPGTRPLTAKKVFSGHAKRSIVECICCRACIRARTLKRSSEFIRRREMPSVANYSPGRRSFSEFEDAVILNELFQNARDKPKGVILYLR